MMTEDPSRRAVLGAAGVALAASVLGSFRAAAEATSGEKKKSDAGHLQGMPYRTLGRTGERVSLVGLGGYHLGNTQDEATAIALVRRALDAGINFLDNSWDYHDGESERRAGKALRDGYRAKAFVMTKLDGRTAASATTQLHQSLTRLQTEVIDLIQVHEVIRMNDAERIFAPGGAIEGLLAAKKAGKVRFIGFTGHKDPAIHLHMLQTATAHDFTFDTVQMPLNVMDPHYKSFAARVIPEARKREMGILGMKAFADGSILKSHTVEPMECLHYAMNLPTSVVITGCEKMEILEQAILAARTFKPMDDAAVRALLARTAHAGKDGHFEPSKVTDQHDSTSKHPEWLG